MNRHSTSIGSAPSSPSQVGKTHDATGARAAKTTLAVLINYNDLGSQATERGAYSEALADYTQAIKHSPQLPEPLYNRALTYGRLHRERDALQDALASVKIDPLFADGFALSARLSCSGEKRKRLVSYPQIRRLSLHIESASEETSSWSQGIAAQLNRTMHGQPRSPSKTHPAKRDDNFFTWRNFGVANLCSRHPQMAIGALDRALAIKPSDPLALRYRADARRVTGDLLGAITDATRSLALDPTNAKLLMMLGVDEYRRGAHNLGAAHYRRGCALLSTDDLPNQQMCQQQLSKMR